MDRFKQLFRANYAARLFEEAARHENITVMEWIYSKHKSKLNMEVAFNNAISGNWLYAMMLIRQWDPSIEIRSEQLLLCSDEKAEGVRLALQGWMMKKSEPSPEVPGVGPFTVYSGENQENSIIANIASLCLGLRELRYS